MDTQNQNFIAMKTTLTILLAFFFGALFAQNECDETAVLLSLQTGSFAYEIDFDIVDPNGDIVFTLSEADTVYIQDNSFFAYDLCLPAGCYVVNMYDSFGDGWNGATLTVSYGQEMFPLPSLETGDEGSTFFGVNDPDCVPVIPGCTDAAALNYQPWATEDDGSCEYPFSCEDGVAASLYICTFSNGNQVELDLLTEDGVEIISVDNLGNGTIEYFEVCLPADGCLLALMSNNSGPNGWFNGYFWINVNGQQVVTGALPNGYQNETIAFSLSDNGCPVFGCTDPEALNYNEEAVEDDGSCTYPIDCGDENHILVTLTEGVFPGEISWELLDENGDVLAVGTGNGALENEFCAPDGCYTLNLYDSFGDGWNDAIISVAANGAEILTTGLLEGDFGQAGFGLNNSDCEVFEVPIPGCTDTEALNFNPSANTDNGSCIYPIENDLCANATPLNQGVQQISNLGAIENEGVWGDCWAFGNGEGEQSSVWFTFTTPSEPSVIDIEAYGDGSFTLTDTQFGLFEECGGEMIACDGNGGDGLFSAFHFNCNDLELNTTYILMVDGYFGNAGTCLLSYWVTPGCDAIPGCTDPEALNYDPEADEDDGSCVYPLECDNNQLTIVVESGTWGGEIWWELLNPEGDSLYVAMGGNYFSNQTFIEESCIDDGCYQLNLYDNFGDGWNNASISLSLNGTLLFEGTLEDGSFGAFSISVNTEDCPEIEQAVYGCTDPNANNYNPEATINDNSCLYDILGCTDPLALNYNPNANVDDDSCIYPEPCESNELLILIDSGNWGGEISWNIVSASQDSVYVAGGGGYFSNQTVLETHCVEDGCYNIILYDSFGDGWNGGSISIIMNSDLLFEGTLDEGSIGSFPLAVNSDCDDDEAILGCTDPSAMNYDPAATEDDGSCAYGMYEGPMAALEATEPDVLLFPVPVIDDATVDVLNGDGAEAMIITVFDMTGKVVYLKDFGLDQTRLRTRIPSSQFAAGIYMLHVQNGSFTYTTRLIKQ